MTNNDAGLKFLNEISEINGVSMYWKMEGREAVPATVMEWANMYEDGEGRTIARDKLLDGGELVTCFMGVDHTGLSCIRGNASLAELFGTAHFDKDGGMIHEINYHTLEQAEQGHVKRMEKLK